MKGSHKVKQLYIAQQCMRSMKHPIFQKLNYATDIPRH